jgi:glyoxylase-like metal-dependent hydrolase (beta-lactamase superfamily II)
VYLVELGQGVLSLIDGQAGYGNSNIGLVIDADGLTVIDTSATPSTGASVRAELMSITAELELPIKRVVISSSRVPFSGGGAAFWQAGFYGTEATSDQLDAPVNHLALQRLLPHLADAYDDTFATRPITHVIDEPAFLTPAAIAVPLAGESPANLVLQVPNANVVFAGALASFGTTPLAFDGDPAAWAESLGTLLELGTTIVPGHGSPGGAADLADLVGYLQACVAADGDPSAIPAGPWDDWANRNFDAVNTERAARLARGDMSTPHAMFELLGLN